MSAHAAKREVTRGPVGHARRAARLVVLMQQVARGDAGALADLYDETSPSVYGLALSITQSPQLAGTLTTEVYTEAWQQAGRYGSGDGPVLTWLMALAHRHIAGRVRAAGAERPVAENGDRPLERAGRHAEARLDVEQARQALGSLRPTDREVVALAYFGGHTQAEIAQLLGLPLSTVRTSIRDGLVTLRAALGVGA